MMAFVRLTLIKIIIFSTLSATQESVLSKIISLENGLIRGVQELTLFEEKPYFAFKGIPYARSPVGDLRFKPPERMGNWEGVKDTIEFGNVCTQPYKNSAEVVGSEDCLFLNIYTPFDFTSERKLSVMIFIHGGGFYEGSGNDYLLGPDFLVNENVIVVTFNYRLGIFGFMALGIDDYSGNMGLKDQLMAMQWINDNIHLFGGDRNKITIFGHSAGAGSAHFQLLSPATKGLFQRAILQSGSALSPWSYDEKKENFEYLLTYAKSKNKFPQSELELVEFLRPIDNKKLCAETFHIPEQNTGRKEIRLRFRPVIENASNQLPFLTERPEDILKNGSKFNYDIMFGSTSAEFLGFLGPEVNNPDLLAPFNTKFIFPIPNRDFRFDYESENHKILSKEIRDFYFGKEGQVNEGTLAEYVSLISDVYFTYGVDTSVKLHAKVGKSSEALYFYRFSVDGKLNLFKKNSNVTIDGVSHGDELCYLFRCHVIDAVYKTITNDSVEMRVIKEISQLWANFAKYGNPTPNSFPLEWNPVRENQTNFLDIHNGGLSMGRDPSKRNMKFWNELFQNYEYLFNVMDSLLNKSEL